MDEAPQWANAALVTAVAKHLKEASGPQARMLFESLLDEIEKRIDR